MRAILILTTLLAAAPLVAQAQDATERRREQAYDNLRSLEQTQRLNEVDRQISNIELRQRSEQAMRVLSSQTNTRVATPLPTAPPTVLTAEDIARDAELAASNERLREIAAQQRRLR